MKIILFFCFSIVVLISNQNCGKNFTTEQIIVSERVSLEAANSNQRESANWDGLSSVSKDKLVLDWLNNRCASCHSSSVQSGGIGSMTNVQELLAQQLIDPGHPETSQLFGAISSEEMPPGQPASDDEKMMIELWIREKGGATHPGSTPAPEPTPSPEPKPSPSPAPVPAPTPDVGQSPQPTVKVFEKPKVTLGGKKLDIRGNQASADAFCREQGLLTGQIVSKFGSGSGHQYADYDSEKEEWVAAKIPGGTFVGSFYIGKLECGTLAN